MKEHPIIFSTEMVRAILDGRKTQTRRIITIQPPRGFDTVTKEGKYWIFHSDLDDHYHIKAKYKAKYQVGDSLWVRETWWDLGYWYKGKWHGRTRSHNIGPKYVADGEPEGGISKHKRSSLMCKWRKRPSIFMPKWAARIFLEITNIRVERVQDISGPDVYFEGCPSECASYRMWFSNLWNSLNAKRGYGWDKNPWVWVIEFERK